MKDTETPPQEIKDFLAKLPDPEGTEYQRRLETASNEKARADLLYELFNERPDVFIEGLQQRTSLNSCRGVVIDGLKSGRVAVRVLLPRLQNARVRVRLRNLRPADEEPEFMVIWAFNEVSNTGLHGMLAELIGEAFKANGRPGSDLMSIPYKMSDLHRECEDFGWIQHPTTLCEAFGLHIRCFAAPYACEHEHKGYNNVIGTFLTCDRDTGLARNTIIGKAGFVRLSPVTGEPADFTHKEALRALLFLDDLMDSYSIGLYPMPNTFFESIAQCYPYYDIRCTMRMEGFEGVERKMRRRDDGTFEKIPDGMQPVAGHITS